MTFDTRTRLFVFLTAIFVTSLVVGDIIGGKLTEVPLGATARIVSVGMIPFPVTFLLTDILNEFYGKNAARFITMVGFGMAMFTFGLIAVAARLPWAGLTRDPGWTGIVEPSFNNVFTGSQRILAASMVAYLIGQFLDIGVFNLLKRITSNRMLWLRATGSTVVSQLIDTIVIQYLAWEGTLSLAKLLELTSTGYAIKLLVALGLTPLVYAGHVLVERGLGLEPVRLDAKGEPVAAAPPTQG